jgi:Protein of unknown function (DUF559)/Transcriptional regulator, AbiEi antitoxin
MSRFTIADALVAELAARQWGAFSREQALSAGHSPHSIKARIASGLWIVVHQGVYAHRSAVPSPYRDLAAALLWAGGGSMVTGVAAAALYELRSFEIGPVEIASSKRLKPPTGVVLHRLPQYLDIKANMIKDLPTAPIEKVLLDLIASHGKRRGGLALDEALRLRLTTLERFAEFVESVAIQGRNGIRKSRELIAERDSRYEKVRGPSEVDALGLFDGVRLPVAEVDYEIWYQGRLLARADFAYPEVKLIIEIDGYSVHTNKTDRDRDRKRDRKLEALGWTVIRFSWEEVRNDPLLVIRDIKAVLERLEREIRA